MSTLSTDIPGAVNILDSIRGPSAKVQCHISKLMILYADKPNKEQVDGLNSITSTTIISNI